MGPRSVELLLGGTDQAPAPSWDHKQLFSPRFLHILELGLSLAQGENTSERKSKLGKS